MTARRARSWPDAAAHLSVDRLRRELGIRRRVRLLEISMLRVPACWGIVRPAVGLPPLAAEWDDRRLRAALLHELAHVRRWDYAAYFCGQVACALYWPNPAVWWAARRALLASESACDETVLRHGTERRDYASLLVAAAREARRGGLRPRPVMSMASGPDLRDRVRSVLRFRPSPGVSRAVVFRASAAAVALAAGIAALGVESDREARRARALRAVEEPLPEARAAAARTLGDLGESRVVSTLARLLNDESASVRGAAARAIAETGSGLAVRPLMRRLDDPDPRVRESVILALGRTRDRRAYYDLEELTGSTNRRLRLAATWAIGEIKCEPAIDRLSRLLRRSADPKTRLAAARGLRGAPRLLVQGVLRDALADPDPRVRTAAAESLRLVS